MPWKNAYVQPMAGMPFQFFLQQMKDQKSREYMEKYMYPNSQENKINGIVEVKIYGELTNQDREIMECLFSDITHEKEETIIQLGYQCIRFIQSPNHFVEVLLDCENIKESKYRLRMYY